MRNVKEPMVEVIAIARLSLGVNEAGEEIGASRGRRVSLPKSTADALVLGGDAAWPPKDEGRVTADKPIGEALLIAIGHAMRAIDPEEGLLADGRPSRYALRHHLGYDVTAEQRDEATARFSEKRPDLFGASVEKRREIPPEIAGDAKLVVIHQLDRENKGLWTKDDKPDTRALTEIFAHPVSAAERDELWDRYQRAIGQ